MCDAYMVKKMKMSKRALYMVFRATKMQVASHVMLISIALTAEYFTETFHASVV